MSPAQTNKSWIVYLSTFPPRKCGIATFTEDLTRAFDKLFAPGVKSKIVAINNDEVTEFRYGKQVLSVIDQDTKEDYERLARELNDMPQVKLVSIQHEFGLFGKNWGGNLLYFLEKIRKPVVVTFHTVLPNPDAHLKDLVRSIAGKAEQIIVMGELSKSILVSDYGLDKEKITIIPHGLHSLRYSEPSVAKNKLGFENRTVLTTFGLLSRNKGIEYMLDALPSVVERFPRVLYLIIGATHPTILRDEGEAYRNSLVKKVYDLGLTKNVVFYNSYMDLPNLLDFLQATDIYISTGLNPDQAVSGTLTYALGTGRPVISTAFSQAREIITEKVGRLVDFRSPESYTKAIMELIDDRPRRMEMSKNAYFRTRPMVWANVALSYMKLFSSLVPQVRIEQKHLPKIKLGHIARMTDAFGMLQFAEIDTPDPKHGYTLDDNARALIAITWDYQKKQTFMAEKLMRVYLDFISFCSQSGVPGSDLFANYVHYDRTLGEKQNLRESMQDPTARGLLALAMVSTAKVMPDYLRESAQRIFRESLKKEIVFTHIKSVAFYTKALGIWNEYFSTPDSTRLLLQNLKFLTDAFQKSATEGWPWFEDELNYANGIVPDALLWGYRVLGGNHEELFDIAKKSLEFLISVNFVDGIYVPIGQNGWYKKGETRALYDQQGEDPASMTEALHTMYEMTKDVRYLKLAYRAFFWFLGNNLGNQVIYNESTGGCYDGLGEHSINFNQGAESTISYLTARMVVEHLSPAFPALNEKNRGEDS